MLDAAFLATLATELSSINAEHPVIAAHHKLQTALSRYAIEPGSEAEVIEAAIEAAGTVVENQQVWSTLDAVYQNWQPDDAEFVTGVYARAQDQLIDGETRVLIRAGMRPEIANTVVIQTMYSPPSHEPPPNPQLARRRTEELAEELRQKSMQDEYEEERKDRQTRGLLRRVGRVVHVVTGGAMMLADGGATAGAAIVNPFAGIATGAVALVSLKKGSDTIRKGISKDF